MKTLYATKPDRCGNTYKLVIDTDKRQYSHENSGFFHRSDAITTTRANLRRLEEEAKRNGYTAAPAL